jgi:anthraniloyl-CoA monooxygenase
MKPRTVHIVGGGPGGLYLALLLARRNADWHVSVHETTPPAETFGFGVGFTGATLRRLAEADPDSHAEILRRAYPNPTGRFEVEAGVAPINFRGNVAIARGALLELLSERAVAAGADLRLGGAVEVGQFDATDVVVACDGAGSRSRQERSEELGARISTGAGLYLWCGADVALPCSIYTAAEAAGGVFVAHAYPYADDRSTFLIETDTASWEASGLAASAAGVRGQDSDTHSLALLQDAFSATLGNARLIANHSQWKRFRTVSLERWFHGNVAWLGDAAHTAHYSVGSGTKMAMEDAIALADALGAEPDLAAAFGRYERERRPAVLRLQRYAHRSEEWWESFPLRRHLPAQQLALAFLTRNGNLDLGHIHAHDPGVSEAAAEAFGAAGDTADAVLDTPLRIGHVTLPGRVLNAWADLDDPPLRYREVTGLEAAGVETGQEAGQLLGATVISSAISAWDTAGDTAVQSAQAFVTAGCEAVRVIPERDDRQGTLVMLDLAERVRLSTGALTVACCSREHRDDVAAALVSGRADAVWFSD